MLNTLTESEAVRIAEEKWNIRFKRIGGGEYKSDGGCPVCGDGGKGSGSDRFKLFTSNGNPRAWCRKCGYQVFINRLIQRDLTAEERRVLAIQAEVDSLKRKQQEHEVRLTKIERLMQLQPHIAYHKALTAEAVEYWYNEGISIPYIDKFLLGYCLRCPTDREGRASYTIPVMNNSTLLNVRHRLIGAIDGDKYRPQMAGLGNQLFNTDSMLETKERVVLWEGEKKTIVLSQYIKGAANVGLMGKSGWDADWTPLFKGFRDVIIALDPDAHENAYKLGKHFRKHGIRNVRIADFPLKPDDAIVKYGATGDQIRGILETSMPV